MKNKKVWVIINGKKLRVLASRLYRYTGDRFWRLRPVDNFYKKD